MFQTLLVQPIYNLFIFILSLVPGGDVGVGIILLTLLVRVVLYPLFTAGLRTQMALQAVQPELNEINEKYKDNTQERARLTAELFKRHKIRFSTLFLSFGLQIAIFLALSYAFFRLGLPKVRTDLLYPFVHAPQTVNEHFLGLVNLAAAHNIILTVVVAALQYYVIKLTVARTAAASAKLPKQQAEMQVMQQRMMLYMFPVMIAAAAYFTAAAVGLYLAATTAFSLVQELIIKRKPL